VRFFTPELLLAYGSDDTAVWGDAEARWEEALAGYEAQLASLRDRMPAGVRTLVDGYRLHDAHVLGMGTRDGSFVVLLLLDDKPRRLLSLAYALEGPPSVNPDALVGELRSTAERPEWQYDEVEMVPGEPATWRQSVLLSNGWELALNFRDVRVEELRPLLPVAVPNGAGSVVGAGQLA
jgi:hypothetical protein